MKAGLRIFCGVMNTAAVLSVIAAGSGDGSMYIYAVLFCLVGAGAALAALTQK